VHTFRNDGPDEVRVMTGFEPQGFERFFLERTQAEVAESLGLSQAHVSRLLEGALVKMRRRLARDESLYGEQRTATLGRHALERPASPAT
jgi:hypothetical protein